LKSPWVRNFAFPVCFILVAVQWPSRLENTLTKGLMRLDTTITVEILGWLDIPAMQHGNLIELATGTVGVDEACSGIRSFQSTLMAALFLGELYLLRRRTRLLLVAGGLALAFGFNVIRTLILAWQANAHGLSAIDKWHDPAGFTITVACFLCLWGIAALIRKRWSAEEKTESRKQKAEIAPAGQPQVSGFIPPPSEASQPSTLNSQPSSSPWSVVRGLTFPLSAFYFLLFFVAWVPFVLLANEAWYRSRPVDQSKLVRWWVNAPTNAPSYREVPVSPFARKLLKYDQGTSAAWTEPDGSDWFVTCLRWRAGDPTARMSALAHRPEYCMTGSGHKLNAKLGTKYLPADGLKLPFRTYVFDAPGRPLYVFFCLWEDATKQQTGFAKTKYHDRLRGVLDRRRGLGQQTLEIICSGYQGIEQAQAAVTARLPELIKLETTR
jgi:exosortase/archaeosortase family protein